MAALAAVGLALLPFALDAYHQALAAQVVIYFIAILGLNILTGYSGQISIGHGAFMAIGGYPTALMSRDHHTNVVVTMLMAVAICFVCGAAPRAARAAPLRHVPRARDLRLRGLGAAAGR